MNKPEISFLHIADTHYGSNWSKRVRNRQRKAYGELFFEKSERAINDALIKHNIDFIIHSGDFFNRSKPPPEVVDRAVNPYIQAAKNNVPIYILPGNHERSKLPFGLLHYQNNFHVFKKLTSFVFIKNGVNIQLTGFPYIRHNARAKFNSIVKLASNVTPLTQPQYKILVLHQLIEGSRVQHYVFRKGHNVIPFIKIPSNFDYIACGHVHRFQFIHQNNNSNDLSRIVSSNKYPLVKQNRVNRCYQLLNESGTPLVQVNEPIIAYPGSLERVSFMEREEPKGYIIGNLCLSDKKDSIIKAEYQFHQLNAIPMIYEDWNLSDNLIKDFVYPLLKKLRNISLNTISETSTIKGVVRVRIKGGTNISSSELHVLKHEAEKLSFYLTFSYNS